jgi:AcrR family transcriptional regulator
MSTRSSKPDRSTKRSGSSKLQETLAAQAARQAKIVEKANRVVERKVAEAEKQQRIAAKATRRRDRIEAISEHLGGADIWTRDQPSSRRPRFTREAIAVAAVRIADAEGIDSLSMRRLATELGSGTMTLYHYVRTKDELYALVVDAVMGEVVLPEGEAMPADWRVAITLLAHRSRDTLERHPWLLDIRDDPAFGPNGVRHFDQTLEALGSLGTDLEHKIDIALLIDEYVFGYALHSRGFDVPPETSRARQMVTYVESLLRTGRYPQIERLAASVGIQRAWDQIQTYARDDDRFSRNLDRLLGGVERDLERRRQLDGSPIRPTRKPNHG